MTFYKYYPTGTDEYNAILEALESNRTINKSNIRDRLMKINSPAALIALYKLLATPEERRALSQKDTEPTTTKEVIEVELQ